MTTVISLYCRIIKEAVWAAGSNLTEKHLEDISLGGLFLLEAAKKTDDFFQVPSPSPHHTIRDASNDLLAMTADLLSTRAVKQKEGRSAPPFQDPSTVGMETRASKGWVEHCSLGGNRNRKTWWKGK